MQIGVPRALLYYNYHPAINSLPAGQGIELVFSTPTSKDKLEQGLSLCEEEVCLPVKVLMGHICWLLERGVDALFVPRIVSLQRRRFICPKFLGLPDMVRSAIGERVPLLSPTVNVNWTRWQLWREGIKAGRQWIVSPLALWRAMGEAIRQQQLHEKQLAAALPRTDRQGLRVAVLGHSYNVHDQYINHGLLKRLQALGAEVVTVENFTRSHIEQGAARLGKDLFWSYGRDLVGAANYCLDTGIVDGIILVVSFGCGPDSLIREIIETNFAHSALPLMSLIMDEHSSATGLATRVEAFIDMLCWRENR